MSHDESTASEPRFSRETSDAWRLHYLDAEAQRPEADRLSPPTLTTYSQKIHLFLQWWTQSHPDSPLTTPLAEAYQLWLIDEREIRHRFSTRTYGLCLSSLKQWGAYLVGQHLLPENPFQTLTGPDRSDSHARGFLTREQANRLLASFDRAQLIEHRDALICQLMLTAGARETELCQATIADFDRTGRQLWLQSKGKQIRESVPLTAPVTAELEAYLARRSAHDPDLSEHDPLLATIRQPGTDRRPHLGTHELRRRLHRAIARAKLTTRHITGVSLRNTCAIQAFLDGIPFHDVQALMRHRDKKTTKLFEQRAKRIRRGSKRSASTAIHP